MNGYFQAERDLLGSMGRDGHLTAADFRVMMLAMRDSKLPGDAVALGINYLATGTGLDRSTVIRSRRHLVQLGYLVHGGFGQRGLSRFVISTGGADATPERLMTGGVNATPGGTDATCRTDATGGVGATGTGGVDATGTGGVDATQIETGNMETTTIPHRDGKTPSSDTATSSAIETKNPADAPLPAKPPKPKKQPSPELDADAEKLVTLYAELVKPKRDDNSGSRKIFIGTAKHLLSEGASFPDLERSIRNYAAARVAQERQEKAPDAARKYRWGFQTFFGPKNEHWRDFVAEAPGEAEEDVDDVNPPELVAAILEGIERERQGLEVI